MQISMSSGFRGSGIDKTEYVREFTYDKPKDDRDRTTAIRTRVNTHKSFSCSRLYDAYFTNETGKAQLTEICDRADRDMKQIDPRFHCTVKFLKQDFSDNENLTALDELIKAIRVEVYGSVEEQISIEIEKNKDHMTNKTRIALHTMVNRLTGLNITGDKTLSEQMDRIHQMIDENKLREIRDEILVLSESTKDRGSALEITSDIKVKSEEKPEPKRIILSDTGSGRSLDI